MESKNKAKVISAIAVIAGLAFGATTETGKKAISKVSSGLIGNISVSTKEDSSKKVKTNVGDTDLGAGAMQLEGVSVGGNVGQIGSNTSTENKSGNSKPQ
jgi:hypothetical protein